MDASENDKDPGEDRLPEDCVKKSVEQELKVAPIPTVNVWQVRQREHEASKAVRAGPPKQAAALSPSPAQVNSSNQAEKNKRAGFKASGPSEKENVFAKEKKAYNDGIRNRDDGKIILPDIGVSADQFHSQESSSKCSPGC